MIAANDIQLSFFRGGITNVDRPETVSLEWAMDHIRRGVEFDPNIRDIRKTEDKKARQELKRKVSYFIFSGQFSKRNAESLVQHSGLIVLDFDEVKDLLTTRLQLQADPFALVLFKSTTGNGLKLIVRIDPEKHLESFKALEIYFAANYDMIVDTSGKDVCRACYTSADESLFFNPEAQLFTPEMAYLDPVTGEIREPEAPQPKAKGKAKATSAPTTGRMDEYQYMELIVNRVCDANLDLTTPYENWQLLAFSLATFGETGRDPFHRLSAINRDQYNPKDCDGKFTNALKTKRFMNAAWFYRRAKDSGIDITWPKGEATEHTASAPVKTTKPKREKREELPEDDSLYDFNWPKNVQFESVDDKREAEKQVRFYQHFSHKHQTYMASFRTETGEPVTTVSFKKAANFSINSFYVVTDDEGRASRLLELTNIRHEKLLTVIPTEAFTSVQEFSKYIEKANFAHELSKPGFTKLKYKIYDDCKACRVISTLGQQPEGFFAFANGIYASFTEESKEVWKFIKINELGVVEYKEQFYFLPALSKIYRDQVKLFQFERQFVHVPRQVSFGDWAELFCNVYGENGRIGLMFYVASVFSDIVFKAEGSFPLLYLYGKPGSGKTTMAISMLSMYHATGGDRSVGSNINSVPMAALFRQLGQVKNGMVLIEEFQPDLEKRQVEYVKQMWNRIAYTKSDTTQSNTSNRTVGMNVESTAVFTGQHLPSEIGFFTRTILLQFFKSDNYSSEANDKMLELRNMQGDSLTQVTLSVLSHRQEVQDKFNALYQVEKKVFSKDFKGGDLVRVGQHCAGLTAMYLCLKDKVQFPFSEADFRATLMKVSTAQVEMLMGSDDSSTFWEIMQSLLFSSKIKEEEDFFIRKLRVVKVRKTEGEGSGKNHELDLGDTIQVLYLRLGKVHGLYNVEMKMQGRKNTMDKTGLANYLKHSKPFIGTNGAVRFAGTGDVPTSAYLFRYDMLLNSGVTLQKAEGTASVEDDLGSAVAPGEPLPPPPVLQEDKGELPF